MSDAFHLLTIAAMSRSLRNLGRIMDKTKEHAKAKGLSLESLLEKRLYSDMFNLLQQFQYACYVPVEFAKHFSGNEPPRVGYDEESWEECRKSIDLAAGYLESIKALDIAKQAEKPVPLFFDEKRGMPAVRYAADFLVPDFFFHVTVAYGILRNNGIPLGKSDFIGALETTPLG